MQSLHSVVCRTDPACELRVGNSSWDLSRTSIKYTWFTTANTAARGGEAPLEAYPQMVEVAMMFYGLPLEIFDLRTQQTIMTLMPGGVGLRWKGNQ